MLFFILRINQNIIQIDNIEVIKRVFVTSRPELPIRLGFSDIKGKYQDLILHEIPKPIIEHDISAFLNYKLTKIKDDYNTVSW